MTVERYAIYKLVYHNGHIVWDYGPIPAGGKDSDVVKGELKDIHIIQRYVRKGDCGKDFRRGQQLLTRLRLEAARGVIPKSLVTGEGWPQRPYLSAISLRYGAFQHIKRGATVEFIESWRKSLIIT